MSKWKIEYDNDTGVFDDYFMEWWEVTDGDKYFRCNTLEDAQWLLAKLSGTEWISVNDSVPDDFSEDVLIAGECEFTAEPVILMACWNEGYRPTHWMSLPKPPEE